MAKPSPALFTSVASVGALGALVVALLTCQGGGAPPNLDGGLADDASTPRDSGVARPVLSIADYPRLDGSTSTLPLDRVIACELLGLPYRWQAGLGDEGQAEIVPVWTTAEEHALADAIMARIVHNKTHQAYLNLIDGTADLIFVANPPSVDEQAAATAAGVVLEWQPLAYDALVVIVNAANPVDRLTAAQVRGIFHGDVNLWSQVGGTSEPIHPYVRPDNSGSQELMKAIVMGGEPMPSWPPDRTIRFMGALIDAVRSDRLAIGYSVYYWVTYQYGTVGYRVLAIDGVQPTSATIADRSYPYVAPVLMVRRAGLDAHGGAGQLHDWLLTQDGQSVVGRSGYVPALRP